MFCIESDTCDRLMRKLYSYGYNTKNIENMTVEDKARYFDIIISEIDKIYIEEQDIRMLRYNKRLRPGDKIK